MIEAVLKTGLISKETLAEMKRFSPVIPTDAETEEPKDLDTCATIIATAIESEGYVVVRETDLDALKQYFETSTAGVMHVEDEGVVTDFNVTFGKTKLGEYIIPWRGESIEALLTNGSSFLQSAGVRVFFDRVRELFFDETKAFMICHASTEEPGAPS